MKILPAVAIICLAASPILAADDAASQLEKDFVAKAAVANMFEIEAAKIEVAKGKAQDARQFAQDMLRDHRKAGAELAQSASEDNVPVPTVLDDEHQQKLIALAQSDAANLDQAYLSTQVTAHQQAVDLFAAYSKDGPDGKLKGTVTAILPDLRMHLTRVVALTSK